MKIEATYCTPKEGRDLKILGSGKLLKVAELCNGRELRAWGKTESEGSGPKRIGSYVGPMDCQGETLRLELELEDSENLAMLFEGCLQLKSVDSIGQTGAAKSFSWMFAGCQSLKEAPRLDTSKGENFTSMFESCQSLERVPELDTRSGENFSWMFAYCSSLKGAPRLDTRNGENFSSMFHGCESLERAPDYALKPQAKKQKQNED